MPNTATATEPPFRLPARDSDAHKGSFGRVLAIGGSRGMAGSISITASAALRSGAGLVTAVVPDRCLETVASANLCVMTMPLPDTSGGHFAAAAAEALSHAAPPCSALAFGPGIGRQLGSDLLLRWVLSRDCPCVIDADGLNLLSDHPKWSQELASRSAPLILTPHPGEWERLSQTPAGDRQSQAAAAEKLAAVSGAIIVLKGAATLVTDGARTIHNPTGNPGMATGGSGDCLTGIIASLLAQGCSAWEAAQLGVWIHGRAGDRAAAAIGMGGMIATDLLEHLPAAMRDASHA